MEKRALGRSGLKVAPLALGGNVFGWTADRAASERVLDGFVDAGFDLIDTADMYSAWAPGNKGGESETIIGDWLKRRGGRDRIVLATKVGADLGPGRQGLSPKRIRQAIEDSLRRLQTDHVDLYQSHYDDTATPQEETLATYGALIEEGKVRAIGASNCTAARLAEALDISRRLGLPRYETLQPHYNLVERAGYEAEFEPLCRREGLGVIPYFSLASGFLTGKYRSEADFGKSVRGGGMAKYLDDRGRRVLAALDQVAADRRATPAQVALAWLIARPGITAPIASATGPEQLQEILGAARLSLTQGDLAALDGASA
ncbi:MAG: aldo/keto reductase [Dongiaceae bacterium]